MLRYNFNLDSHYFISVMKIANTIILMFQHLNKVKNYHLAVISPASTRSSKSARTKVKQVCSQSHITQDSYLSKLSGISNIEALRFERYVYDGLHDYCSNKIITRPDMVELSRVQFKHLDMYRFCAGEIRGTIKFYFLDLVALLAGGGASFFAASSSSSGLLFLAPRLLSSFKQAIRKYIFCWSRSIFKEYNSKSHPSI